MTTGSDHDYSGLGPSSNGGYYQHQYDRSWTGEDGFKDANGKIRWNQYETTISRFSTNKFNNLQSTWALTIACGPWSTMYDPWTANHDNNLLNSAESHLQGSDFNLAVFSGELGEFSTQVYDTARDIVNLVRQLKRGQLSKAGQTIASMRHGNKPSAKSLANAAGSRWLGAQYGIIPAMADLREAGMLLDDTLRGTRPKKEFTIRESAIMSISNPSCYPSSSTGAGTWRHTKKVRVTVEEDLDWIGKLQLDDPFSFAWEMLPFSFVVDWFLPIGDYVAALNAQAHFKLRYPTVDFSRRVGYASGIVGSSFEGCTSQREMIVYKRTLESLNARPPVTKPLEKSMSLGHVENAIALLSQAFTPERTPFLLNRFKTWR